MKIVEARAVVTIVTSPGGTFVSLKIVTGDDNFDFSPRRVQCTMTPVTIVRRRLLPQGRQRQVR